jgi:hypothetical protein
MSYRGVVDTKGEVFALLAGDQLYTLEYELTGRVEGDYIVDISGKPVWRLIGDGVYTVDGIEPIGYISGERPADLI